MEHNVQGGAEELAYLVTQEKTKYVQINILFYKHHKEQHWKLMFTWF